MEKLAQLSPQAGHYFDILTSLSDAVGIYQRRLSEDRKRMASQYMDQIFTLGSSKQSIEQTILSDNPSATNISADDFDSWHLTDNADPNKLADNHMMPGPYGAIISEGFPWPADDLEFEWQTYAPFVDDTY